MNIEETERKEGEKQVVEEKKDDEKELCQDFIQGKCKLGKKCDKKHKRTQFNLLMRDIDPQLFKEFENNYFLRKKLKKEESKKEDSEEVKEIDNEAEDALKVKMTNRKEKKEKSKGLLKSKEKEVKKPKVLKEKKVKVPKEKKERKKKVPKEPKEKKQKAPKEKKFTMMTSRSKIADKDCEEFLKGECSKVFCDKIHNFTLKYKEQNNEEFTRRYFTVYQDFTVLEPFQKKLYAGSCLDLMFLCDCTGSMASWINTVKDELKNIISFIKDSNPYSKVRISFVGYRDFDMKEEERNSILNFTENAEEAKKFISEVRATGGADAPEDIAGGLKRGLEQNWMNNSAKYCILIADAPCHGEKYHNFDDDYPNGCPNGLVPEDLLEEYAKRQITFYAVKIKQYTDQMYKIFSDRYQEITKQPIVVADLGKSTEKFAFLVAVAANSTLSSVTINNISLREFLNAMKKDLTATVDNPTEEYNSKFNNFVNRVNTLMVENEDEEEKKDNGMIIEEENMMNGTNNLNSIIYNSGDDVKIEVNLKIIENKNPNFSRLPDSETVEAICHSFFIKKDRNTNINWKNPFIQNSNIKSKVTVSKNPFSMGCNRYAFYMKDNDLNQNLVAKLPKVLRKKEYTIEGLTKDLETITICNHIVNDFNDRIVNLVPDTRLLLNFIHSYIYQILDPGHPYQFYSVENHIMGEYVKYNNNAGWLNQNVTDQTLLAQTFSHFSWQITRGYLIVVDLQGVGGFLTDPQIHCINQKKYGNGNFGYIGIMKFFMSHTCNSYCKKLELIHPRNFVNIDKDYSFFVDKYIPPSPTATIYKLCDICRNPYQANALQLYELKKKCWEGYCNDCDNKRKNSFKGAKCTVCNNFFKSSAYVYQMKRNSFPDKCMKCRQVDRNNLRDDYYRDPVEDGIDII